MKKNQLFLLLSFLFIQLHAQSNKVTLSPGLIARIKEKLSPSFLKNLSKTRAEFWQAEKEYNICLQKYCPQEKKDREQLKPGSSGVRVIINKLNQCGSNYCLQEQNRYNIILKKFDRDLAKLIPVFLISTTLSLAVIDVLIYYFTGAHIGS